LTAINIYWLQFSFILILYFKHNGMSFTKIHLSRLTGKASHPDVQKIRIIGIFFEIGLHWQFEIRLLLFRVFTCV
jgi:hypothetical protein